MFTFCNSPGYDGQCGGAIIDQVSSSEWELNWEGSVVDIFAVPPGLTLADVGGPPSPAIASTLCQGGRFPVNCASGAFWHTFQDAQAPGNGLPLDFTRTYSSLDASADGPLGYGWIDSYDMSLSFDAFGNPTVIEAETVRPSVCEAVATG